MSTPKRVLLVDDNPDDRLLTVLALGKAFPALEVEQIGDAQHLSRALEAGDFDLVITRDHLCWGDGLEVLRQVKERWGECPVLMVTAADAEGTAVEAMRVGLDDYVVRSTTRFVRLASAVQLALGRAQQRKALRAAETRYWHLFERVPVGLYRTALDGRIVEANSALVEMLGYPDRESLLAVSAAEMFAHPEEREREQALLEREGVVRGFEMQLRRCDGTVIWVRDTCRAVRDGDGQVTCYEGSLEDITERKHAEEALDRQRGLYESLLKVQSDLGKVLVILDLESTQILYASEAFSRITGYTEAELLALPSFLRMVVPEEGAVLRDLLHGWMQRQGVSDRCEVTVVGRHGQHVRLEITANEVYQVEGRTRAITTVRDVTERRRAEEALRHYVERLRALHDIDQAILETRSPEEITAAALRHIRELVPCLGAGVVMLDPEAGEAVVVAAAVEELPVRAGMRFSLQSFRDSREALEALHQGQVYVGEDFLDLSQPLPVVGDLYEKGMRAVLSVPLLFQDELVGFLALGAGEPHDFDDEGIEIVREVARSLAIAVQRERAEEEIRRHTAQLEALRQVGLELTAELNLDALLRFIVSKAVELVGGTSGGLYLYRPERNLLEWVVSVGSLALPVGAVLRRGEGLSGQVWETGQPLIVDDYQQWEGRAPTYDGLPVAAVVGVPVQWGGRLLGVVNVSSDVAGVFTPADAEQLNLFATQAAIAIQNARLFEQEREQRELAEALAEAAAVVGSTLDLDQVLDRILVQVERVVTGDAFDIMLIEDGKARMVRWRGYERVEDIDRFPPPPVPLTRYPSLVKMAQTGRPVVLADIQGDPDWVHEKGQEWLRAYVAAPIRVAGVTVGFLNVTGSRPGQFGPDDGWRLEVFARQAATAVENAQLYRELRNYTEGLEDRVRERTAQLQAQYARLEAILRSTTDGIVVTDREGEVMQANPVALRWLSQTLAPHDAQRLREALRGLAQRARERPERLLELSGLDLQLNAAPIAEPGADEGAVVAVHDVSHLKALDRMKSRFVSNVSHELRTPITTIQLYAGLLRQSPPEKLREYLDALENEANRQARLVEDILQISRIEAGRLELSLKPIPLNDLADAVVVAHRVLAESRQLTLKHRPAKPGPVALADRDQMTQVLNNLVLNAIQYTPEGGRVTVSAGRQEADGREWGLISVADSGIGIPDEELPHIFERFFRGERPQQLQIPGTGLGLAIVKEIVELHGGRITVESHSGRGTTFTVWLPLAEGR
jgi:PAS domain S-box-containing protein